MDNKRQLLFIVLFGVAALIADQIKIFGFYADSTRAFSLLEFFGPIAGGFLGGVFGAVAVLLAKIAGFLIAGTAMDFFNIARLATMAFAAYYFATYSKQSNKNLVSLSTAVPVAAILLFILHPIGNQVWHYALFWTIPIIAKLLPENLFMRSLGATFTAHAVGGTLFIYSFGKDAAFWNSLIPIVAYERLVFAIGIAVSFVVMNTVLDYAISRSKLLHNNKYKAYFKFLNIDKRYVIFN